ncbi:MULTISPECIES: hypothetical protein [Arthrobacter]|uniref:Uncharacterized protein n=1 Tax=Arthrobacter terricola TaxID=2547396 RepID=A0A4R5K5G8_9MICC|nr:MULTISPECIES: hypothetical protein [Arthrobacter]MBT8163781.1 hypothetical protein [Arthrobacter sp. GN70]TDF86747.1 hypothetical protein E1809_25580 [Arthrobacter terricola]
MAAIHRAELGLFQVPLPPGCITGALGNGFTAEPCLVDGVNVETGEQCRVGGVTVRVLDLPDVVLNSNGSMPGLRW